MSSELNSGDMLGFQAEAGKTRVLTIGRRDGKMTIFATVDGKAITDYSSTAFNQLRERGYKGTHEEFMKDISLALYAKVCGQEDVPRIVFWKDDSKEDKLTKLRDVIAYQRWGKTINQYPRMKEILPSLHIGIVKDDPIGFARGAAVRDLIRETHGKSTSPFIYFDNMRRYPQYVTKILELMKNLQIEIDDLAVFDPDFFQFFIERFNAAVNVLDAQKPGAEPWETWPLDENPVWQKYIEDWDDYHSWLVKRRQS